LCFFSGRRRHTRFSRDWSSDVCSSDLVLTIENAKLPKKLARSMDTSALDTPVKMVSTFAVPGATPRVRVVVAADGNIEESAAARSEERRVGNERLTHG